MEGEERGESTERGEERERVMWRVGLDRRHVGREIYREGEEKTM